MGAIGFISANFHTHMLLVVRTHIQPVNPNSPIDVLAAAVAAANISRCKAKLHGFIIKRLGEQPASVSRA